MTDPVIRLSPLYQRQVASLPHRPRWVGAYIERADPNPSEWALVTALGVASLPVGAAAWFGMGPGAAALMVAVTLGSSIVLLTRWRGRSEQRMAAGLPIALDAIARELRTGNSLALAIDQSERTAPLALRRHFARVNAAVRLGRPIDHACRGLKPKHGSHSELDTAATLLAMVAIGSRGGARALEEGASALRQRASIRGEVRALVAQAESSVRVLAALPPVFVALGLATGQSGAGALFASSTGRLCLVVGLGFDLAGLVWMRALVRSVSA